ncbi:hypothetical protein BHE90_016997 [Fusarium euwallaceae]|uniref:Aromatic amino acid beta-eliminating lyase/threonine aldolase domain-containing protein n=1 Tax=Fusarium euwallaceae TaxID=1147111 RepID=A0A430KYU3_9HYPO|nr:hypothetical protein BHE90_016997 [Fusarium euwallaceae]
MCPDGFLAASWRIKMIERIRQSTRGQREEWIRAAGYNLFELQSDQVFIDLLTDSGTGAMSDRQWAALLVGDETYAGSSSFSLLEGKVKALFGFPYVLPVHQGRAAENILFSVLINRGNVVPGNSHFDTTRAHIEYRQATAVDCPLDNAFCIGEHHPFKGNVDLQKLKAVLDSENNNVPMIVVTVTCNKTGDQPVSLDNMRRVRALAREYRIPVVFDSARFAENAWFIQKREPGYSQKTIEEIVWEMHQCADAMVMSAKKDCNGNVGGILAMRDEGWFRQASENVILFEGFTKYGGMAGRDMEALAIGLDEATCSDYLDSRIGQVQRLGDRLIAAGIPVQRPVGGHAIVVDASAFLPLVPKDEYAAQVLAVELYLEAGVRGVEVGTLMNDRDADTGRDRREKAEFMRLAIPRRVYTNDQLDVVANALISIYRRRSTIFRGFRILDESKRLRHFTVTLERAGYFVGAFVRTPAESAAILLVHRGASVGLQPPQFEAYCAAIRQGLAELTEVIVKARGIDVNSGVGYGCTGFLLAAYYRQSRVLRALLDLGAEAKGALRHFSQTHSFASLLWTLQAGAVALRKHLGPRGLLDLVVSVVMEQAAPIQKSQQVAALHTLLDLLQREKSAVCSGSALPTAELDCFLDALLQRVLSVNRADAAIASALLQHGARIRVGIFLQLIDALNSSTFSKDTLRCLRRYPKLLQSFDFVYSYCVHVAPTKRSFTIDYFIENVPNQAIRLVRELKQFDLPLTARGIQRMGHRRAREGSWDAQSASAA